MEREDAGDLLAEAVRETIVGNPEMVRAWLLNEPGSWGFLAGRAVLAYRDKRGRKLTDMERRAVWDLLWRTLTRLSIDAPNA
jgi:hypothetical protein